MKRPPEPLQVILFDLGDTLIYFDERNRPAVLAEAHRALRSRLHESGVMVEQAFMDDFFARMQDYYRTRDTEFIEYTTQFVLRTTLNDWGLGDTPEAILRWGLRAFHHVTQAHWIPEADALPALSRLREMGLHLGLVTNGADEANTQTLVDKAGLRDWMDVIVSSAALGVRKPNPRIFQAALDQLHVRPTQAAMVGDTLGADILGARNAGIFGIWITRRADTPANHAHRDTIIPDAVVTGLEELPGLAARLID